jgi:hypothetical protein
VTNGQGSPVLSITESLKKPIPTLKKRRIWYLNPQEPTTHAHQVPQDAVMVMRQPMGVFGTGVS